MQYLVWSGPVELPTEEHQLVAGPFAAAEDAFAAAEFEARQQQACHRAMPENDQAEVAIATEPADEAIFVLVDDRPRWRIAVSLQLRVLNAGSLLEELVRDIEADRKTADS